MSVIMPLPLIRNRRDLRRNKVEFLNNVSTRAEQDSFTRQTHIRYHYYTASCMCFLFGVIWVSGLKSILRDQFQAIMTQFLAIYFQIYLFALDWAIFVSHFLDKFSNSIGSIDQYKQKACIKRLFSTWYFRFFQRSSV